MSAAEGRMPKAAMDATTAALFPDSFEESELGLVPKGWSIGCVGDLANQKKGSVNPLASPEVLFEHYSLPAFDSDQAPVFELGQQIKSNKTPLPDEAVLLSKLNPHIPRVWLPVNHGANAVCSTEFLAYSPQEGVSKELIYCLFVAAEFQQQLCQLVTGTSNSHQRVKPDQVLLVKIPIADKPVLKAFAELAKPLFERVHANRQQAQTLTQLRDTLLPRLISGQLRLPEAESLMEKAL
jgi:type I restriction enzyme S subunit